MLINRLFAQRCFSTKLDPYRLANLTETQRQVGDTRMPAV